MFFSRLFWNVRIVVFIFTFICAFLFVGSVLAQENVAPSFEPLVPAEAVVPGVPVLTYESIPDAELWYATTTAFFTWRLPADVTKVALVVSNSSTTEPEVSYDPPVEGVSLTSKQLAEGIQYLHVQFKNAAGWGATLHRKIMIDTVPPLPFEVYADVIETENPEEMSTALFFEAVDEVSGIEGYELYVGDQMFDEVLPEVARAGYRFTEAEDGVYDITVRAYDGSLNWRESTSRIGIVDGMLVNVSNETTVPEEVAVVSPQSASDVNALTGLFVLVSIWLLLYVFYMRKRFGEREEKLRKETKEVERQMQKIFTLLRDEVYTQINALSDKKTKLTTREKATIESLNTILTTSEAVLENEVKDIDALLAAPKPKKKKSG